MTAPLYGLVLAGGRSARMGQDKAILAYHGATQLDWAMALIKPCVERAFVSVRPDQINEPVRSRHPQIVDTDTDLGPIAGMVAAQAKHPEAAWLVLACDLPFLNAATLKHLISAREPRQLATAYRSSRDGLPEPLCAIYEPASREAIAGSVTAGKHCPRKFLMQSNTRLLDQSHLEALDNINTPQEHENALHALGRQGKKLRISVQYYALLRDQAKRREETVETQARNPKELYEELKRRYAFTLPTEALRVAVNAEFGSWTQTLTHHDTVVFIPPVAGG